MAKKIVFDEEARKSLLKGIDEIIAFRTGIDVIAAPHPENAVAIGTGRYLEVLGS